MSSLRKRTLVLRKRIGVFTLDYSDNDDDGSGSTDESKHVIFLLMIMIDIVSSRDLLSNECVRVKKKFFLSFQGSRVEDRCEDIFP